jgi:hypothetical protein
VTTRTIPPPPKFEAREPGYLDEVMERIRALHVQILARRGGELIDVDEILDELRGRRVHEA